MNLESCIYVSSKVEEKEVIILGGDMNGHIGKTTACYEDVHGGFGYGVRNAEGERILEFGLALDMVVCNTLFNKRSSRLITYSSGGVNNEEKVMLAGSNLEVVDKFCYLGDMLDAGGGAESSTITRVRSGWKKFK